MLDRYTKAVLTVIAAALVVLVLQNAFPGARAQSGSTCGGARNPCYVTATPSDPVFIAAGNPLFVHVR